MDKIETVLEQAFSLDKALAFFPIRHHSPACAYHVKKAIELYQPDCILIEGPSDTDGLLSYLNKAQCPISIYYSYHEGETSQACYYPLLDFSPELVAVKQAISNEIPVHFIDLPFANMVQCQKPASEIETTHKQSYYDDYYLQRSRYIESLCTKENCRSYSELWEKLFEIPVMTLTTPDFIKNMLTLCYYSRLDYPKELLQAELNPIREQYMVQMIRQYQEQHQRILVITGGFHTAGIMALLNEKKQKAIKAISGHAYLIPYSFEECDQLSGYESGMPYPAYYQDIFENLREENFDSFQKSTLIFIAKIAKKLRKSRENISLSEEAAAFAMTLGLASLRGKQQGGVYELQDGIQSAFIKGELNLSTSFVLREMRKVLRGTCTGKVSDDAPIPPIVIDFQNKAKKFKMDISISLTKSITLDIVSKPKHRQQSVFLHQLQFLSNPFAKKIVGPDFEGRTKTRLLRERWDYSYSGRVSAALIENSHLGGSVAEAAASKLSELIHSVCHNAQMGSDLLIKAGIMGLFEQSQRLILLLEDLIQDDHSFQSLVECLSNLNYLRNMQYVLQIENLQRMDLCLQFVFERVTAMLPLLVAADEKEDYELACACKLLYQLSVTDNREENQPLLLDNFTTLLNQKNCPVCVEGAVSGLLYNAGQISLDGVLIKAKSYFLSSGEKLQLSGRFLRGLFFCAKDVVFYETGFLTGLNDILCSLPYEDFLPLLPDFRLAFTGFTPHETEQIAQSVLQLFDLDEKQKQRVQLTIGTSVNELDLILARQLDQSAYEYLKEKGFLAKQEG